MTSSKALSAETIAVVKATRPVLADHGLAIAQRLYERLFEEYPVVETLFSGAAPGQAERLAGAILGYCDSIEDLDPLVPVVQAIGVKHVAAGVAADHYVIVGDTLLAAMVDVLGELDTAVIDAWAEAYNYLAAIFIEVEAALAVTV